MRRKRTHGSTPAPIRTIRDAVVLKFVVEGFSEPFEIEHWYHNFADHDISRSALNGTLRRLRSAGLIRFASTGRGETITDPLTGKFFPKRSYVATAAGKRALAQVREQLRPNAKD